MSMSSLPTLPPPQELEQSLHAGLPQPVGAWGGPMIGPKGLVGPNNNLGGVDPYQCPFEKVDSSPIGLEVIVPAKPFPTVVAQLMLPSKGSELQI